MGVRESPVCPALPRWGRSSRPCWTGWSARDRARWGEGGGEQLLVAGLQGQLLGRCSRSRRAEEAIRAGILISWARIVAVRALAWNDEAREPAARVRLNAMAAQTSQTALVVNFPESRCASGPALSSAM